VNTLQTATLAGGCFWCLEAAFAMLRGVEKVVSGYMGGHLEQPTYEQVCGGHTGHAEVVQVSFDPGALDYAELLEVFFAIHDPTTPDRQGNDVGSQYRSAIFCHDAAQRAAAEAAIARLESERRFAAPIVTEVREAGSFWPAEAYHRDYYRQHLRQPYCQFVVAPKVAKVRSGFATLLK
jgi:peptide-methionine (S)-S-oxide reductase